MRSTAIYFVETRAEQQRHLLCQWVEHFYEVGKRVQVVADSTMSAQQIDQLLWSFDQGSFIPHRVHIHTPQAPDSLPEPVIITVGEVPQEGFEVLVSDGPIQLEFAERFETVVHFVLMDDTQRRQESRLLWQRARDQGFRTHHVPYSPQGRFPSQG